MGERVPPQRLSDSGAPARRVLVVEDDAGLNNLVRKTLGRCGFETLGAYTGDGAIHAALSTPDVVLLVDHQLPDMLGTDLVRNLAGQGQPFPFVAMTGHGDERVAVEMMKLGAKDYLVKDGGFVDLLPDVLRRVFREIETERRLDTAERDLRESEAKFRRLVEHSPGIVYVHSIQHGGRYYSARAREVLGHTVEHLLENGFLWHDAIHPEDLPRVDASLAAAGSGTLYDMEYRIRTASGEWRWLRDRCMGVHEEKGECLVEGLAMDVTSRRQAEQALRESVEKFKNLFEHSPLGMFLLDAGGVVTDVNTAAGAIFGVPREKYLGCNLLREMHDGPHKGSMMRGLREGDSLAEGPYTSFLSEKYLVLKSRTSRISPDRFLVILEDVTELKRMQELLVQNEKMMSIGGLAAGMAHEINNPLSGILQGAQVVLNRITSDMPANIKAAQEVGCDLEKVRTFLARRDVPAMIESMRDSASRAAQIVRNMLEFSRKSESVHAPADVNAVLDKAVELCASDYDLKKKYDFRSIVIAREYDPDLPLVPCTVTRIEQVFMNLLRNAAQAMAASPPGSTPGKITLRTLREGDMARIEIEDNGPGMDDATRRRIFEPFFTTKPQGEGTGLGLSVSYFIITENHCGTIEVTSQVGKGTVFVIRLPISPAVSQNRQCCKEDTVPPRVFPDWQSPAK
jgi:PAS domain S-box-containing protein